MIHIQGKKQSITLKKIQMMDILDKYFKSAILNVVKVTKEYENDALSDREYKCGE